MGDMIGSAMNLGGGAPWYVSLIVFLAVSAGVLFVLSGGKLVDALLGILRVVVTVFTTPFIFLRDALTVIRSSSEAEKDYQRTRVFMLFRYSRIQYLLLLIGALLVLSGGITTSLVSLYPSQELEMSRSLNERVRELRDAVREAESAVEAAGSPQARQNLETQRTTAQAAFEEARRQTTAFAQTAPVPGDYVGRIRSAQNAQMVQYEINSVVNQLAGCPNGYNWRGFSQADCDNIRAFVTTLGERRNAELTAQQTYNTAEQAFRQADSGAAMATANLEALQQQLKATRDQAGQVSLFNPSVMGGKIAGAIAGLIGTALAVVLLVWFGAIFIDVLNWIILLMRAAEKDNSAKLEHANAEYER